MTEESAPGTRKDRKMLGSLYSAVSGLKAHQTKMNVIGNNIANVNTYGFKASRVTFSDVFYQTISSSTASDSDTGGTNASQLGYGTTVASIDVLNTQAGSATTDRALDVYINGEGYLAAKTNSGEVLYTRVGNMNFDSSGNLVDSNGNMILGLNVDKTTGKAQLDADGTTDTSKLTTINIDPKDLSKYSNISIDATGSVTGTKEGNIIFTKGQGTGWLTTAKVDGVVSGDTALLSGKTTMSITRADNTVGFIADAATPAGAVGFATDAAINGGLKISVDTSVPPIYTLNYTALDGTGAAKATGTATAGVVTFAVPNNATPAGTTNITVNVGAPATPVVTPTADGITLGTVVSDNLNITLHTYNKAGEVVNLSASYSPTGTAKDIVFKDAENGSVTFTVDPAQLGVLTNTTDATTKVDTPTTIGSFGAGDSTVESIGSIALCKFANANGLTEAGSGYYKKGTNSGDAVATIPGDTGTGSLVSGALEMSNVDLSAQFTEMITTQRGFQANARMITTSDSILEELVNLKR